MELSEGGKVFLAWMVMGNMRTGDDPELMTSMPISSKLNRQVSQKMGVFVTGSVNGVIRTRMHYEGDNITDGLEFCEPSGWGVLIQHHMMDIAECLANGCPDDMIPQYPPPIKGLGFRFPTSYREIFGDEIQPDYQGRIVCLRGRWMKQFSGPVIDYSVEPEHRGPERYCSYILSECTWEGLDWIPAFRFRAGIRPRRKSRRGNTYTLVGQAYSEPSMVAVDDFNNVRKFRSDEWTGMEDA